MILLSIIIANSAVSLLSLVGLMIIGLTKKTSRPITMLFVSFSAGVLLATAFLSILTEALHDGGTELVLIMTLTGIVFSFLMERFLLWYHHHHENTHNLHPTVILILGGDGVHNFIDGIAIAATFLVSPILGMTTTLAIAAHEIPQELADFMVLTHTGLSRKKALFYNFLSACTAVVGGIVGYFSLQTLEGSLPIALALTAGIFIYIATADLIPELHDDVKKKNASLQVVSFICGIVIVYILTELIGHTH